jgi:hypothetical protein
MQTGRFSHSFLPAFYDIPLPLSDAICTVVVIEMHVLYSDCVECQFYAHFVFDEQDYFQEFFEGSNALFVEPTIM